VGTDTTYSAEITPYSDVRRTARDLLARGFKELRDSRVIPRARTAAWIEVGRDYEGSLLNGTQELRLFEEALAAAFPHRFTGGVGEKEFASMYAFGLVEGAVARIALADAPFRADGPVASTAIDELLALLQTPSQEAVVVRIVSDLKVQGDEPIVVGPLEVKPNAGRFYDAARAVGEILPGAGHEIWREKHFGMAYDLAIVVTRGTAQPDRERTWTAFDVAARQSSQRINAFVTVLRMAMAATTENIVEAVGQAGFVRVYRPRIEYFRRQWMPLAIRRVASLEKRHVSGLTELLEHLERWEGNDPKKPTVLGIALARLNRSYEATPWFDKLVDLCVGLEAVLIGGTEQEEISLKLRTRAAYLLATPRDPVGAIYRDVQSLYGLRSRIMHGSTLSASQIASRFGQVSVSARSPHPSDHGNLSIDRLRDLLRRAILARGFLDEKGIWPLAAKDFDVDHSLIDQQERLRWQAAWRNSLAELGLSESPDSAPPPPLDWVKSSPE